MASTMFWISTLLLTSCLVSFIEGQCLPGWTLSGERCFHLTEEMGSWADGMAFCKQYGGQLANIDSKGIQATIAGMISVEDIQINNVNLPTGNVYKYNYLHDLGIDVTDNKATAFKFSVQACNDAHIALSANKALDVTDTYEIVIGGWSDSQSVIRDCKQCAHMDEFKHMSHPLDCNQAHDFWISWANNYIRVGLGNIIGEQQFMHWNDTSPHPVNYVAVSTGFGSTGNWTFNINKYLTGKFWVAATDITTEGEWLWLPSQTPMSGGYTDWVPNEPNNQYGRQHCLVVDAATEMKWRDDNCEENRNFICEKDMVETIPGVIG